LNLIPSKAIIWAFLVCDVDSLIDTSTNNPKQNEETLINNYKQLIPLMSMHADAAHLPPHKNQTKD